MAKKLVKNHLTGEFINKETAYADKKVNVSVDDEGNIKRRTVTHYYTSEDEFKDFTEFRPKVIEYLWTDILGYKKGMKMPRVLLGKVKELEKYSYECIYNTLVANTDNIVWALNNKQFSSETGKALYIMAIVDNNIMDEYKKMVRVKKQKEQEVTLEEDVADTVMTEEFGTTKRAKDISSVWGDI